MSKPSDTALEARGLTLSWDGSSLVTRDVSLEVAPGQVICLVGKSGCGKTTILHALAGLLAPLEGQVLLHGENVTGKPGRVSYMLQKDLLLPNLTILDNACLPLLIAGESKAAARAKAEPLFERFGIDGTQGLWPSQLSGGMRQRAAFMRTYLMGNEVVLLDEPFSALDAITRTSIVRLWEFESSYVRLAEPSTHSTFALAELGIGEPKLEVYVCATLEIEPSPVHAAASVPLSKSSLNGSASTAQSEKDAQQTAATHAKLFFSIRIFKPFCHIGRLNLGRTPDLDGHPIHRVRTGL